MKKYMVTFLSALIIGFFLAHFFIKQYKSNTGIKVSLNNEELYFIQYGVFSSKESMEENALQLQNYVYNIEDNLYYVYIGITKDKEIADKIVEYYKRINYETIVKKFNIQNKEFIKLLDNYDKVLKSTSDDTVIASILNQILMKYEEVVINGSQN